MFLDKLLLRLIATTSTAAFLVLSAPLCAQTATSPATAQKQAAPQSAKKKAATPKPVAAKGFELEPKAVDWQMMGTLEALNGWIVLGLTTAFLFMVIERAWSLTAKNGRIGIERW